MLKILSLGLLMLIFSHTVTATAYSWNLSRAMMSGTKHNPKGAWAFMQSISNTNNPASYRLLPEYYSPCFVQVPAMNCWRNTDNNGVYPVVGVTKKTSNWRGNIIQKGMPYLHPAVDVPVVIRWTSPINGTVNVMGVVITIDPYGGEVNWTVRNTSGDNIETGHLGRRQNHSFLIPKLSIKKGEALYFVIDDRMNSNNYNDSCQLDLIITSE